MRMTRLPGTVTTVLHRARPSQARRPVCVTGFALVAVVLLVAAAGPAQAQQVSELALAPSLDQVLTNLRNWLIGILSALATVCLTVAGARYVIASGDPGEIEKAKAALRAACLGYALAMLAPVIVTILQSIVGA